MAYSFTDPFRPLRTSMRASGVIIGLGLGGLCLFAPPTRLLDWGLIAPGVVLPVRLAGAGLLSLGAFWLLASSDRIIELPTLITTALANGLIALMLLVGYINQDLTMLARSGRLMLILVVAVALAGATLPLRYFRAEFRR